MTVQVAVVCTVLVVGLIPLTAPLPALGGGVAALVAVAGVALTASVAALGLMVLVPGRARTRTSGRVLLAAVVGTVAAGTAFAGTAGLISRPLLLVAAGALLIVAADTAVHRRRR